MNKTFSTNFSTFCAGLNKGWITYGVLGMLIMVLWVPRLHGPIDLRWDGGVYYVLGTSLAEGKGYRLLNEPGEVRANQYPPLFPLIIAAYQILLGTSDPLVVGQFLRLLSFFVFAVYIFAIFSLLRRYFANAYALFGTIVCLLNVNVYFLSDVCFPDMLYGLLTVGFLLACSGKKGWPTPRWAGAFAITAFLLRSAGIGLLVAWVSEGLLRRQWNTAVFRVIIAMVPVIGWFSYVQFVEKSTEYQRPAYAYQRADYMFYNVSYARNVSLIDPFDPDLGQSTLSDQVQRFFYNVGQVTEYIGESVSSSRRIWEKTWQEISKKFNIETGTQWIATVPLFVLGGLVLFGAGVLATQGHIIIPLCLLSSISIICLTPWPEQFNRYLMPVVPLLALSLCAGITWLLEQSQRLSLIKWRALVRVLVHLVVVGIVLQQIVTAVAIYSKRYLPVQYKTREGGTVEYRLFFYVDSYRAFDSAVDWLMAHIKPTDVIAVAMPHWVYLRTGNKTVMPPFESDPVKAQQFLETVPVAYLLLDEGLAITVDSKRFMKGVVERFPDRWEEVYRDEFILEDNRNSRGNFVIYRRVGLPASLIEGPLIGDERQEGTR